MGGHNTQQGSGQRAATIPQSAAAGHRAGDLEALFRASFFADYRTLLIGGAEEPSYHPGAELNTENRTLNTVSTIHYTRDYFRSALHEVAHWCVAGAARRAREDYGYWYAPDGRDAAQQLEFMRVEVRPQALEALFCAACDHPFRVSLDNLHGDPGDERQFAAAVREHAVELIATGLAERPRRWVTALAGHYRPGPFDLAAALERVWR
ncbi:elongation factor P hydroxylase [Alloalcanivorax mobilis]|uniref:elongation factor P hydroxylase n=1 Tax=Alloalcanivorax mobilis TaxID=2019569 RepID=UPI000C75BA32|nr:elongation factor P hydroxylase [Alloalcanivorax mobilis]